MNCGGAWDRRGGGRNGIVVVAVAWTVFLLSI
jgi:hypothetical protein